jgi:hypothetical protein
MSGLSLDQKIYVLRELRIQHKRFLIIQILAIKRDHPALPDEELLNKIFPPYSTAPVR